MTATLAHSKTSTSRENAENNRYEVLDYLGEGQFALVYRARDLVENRIVAMKKLKMGTRDEVKLGLNRSAIREIKVMQELSHPNLISLLDVVTIGASITLVLDFMDFELDSVIKDKDIVLSISHVKAYMIMTLRGVAFLHKNWILHRDLKVENLLLNVKGELKITDFGLAKPFGTPTRPFTNQVVTRWYRAPELLLGAYRYGGGVDVWAIGCIFAEMLQRAPLFPGESDMDQYVKITQILGPPTDATWKNFRLLPSLIDVKETPGVPFEHIFRAATADVLDFLKNCLLYDPCKRCTCEQALKMPVFTTKKPFASPLAALPVPLKIRSRLQKEAGNPPKKIKVDYSADRSF